MTPNQTRQNKHPTDVVRRENPGMGGGSTTASSATPCNPDSHTAGESSTTTTTTTTITDADANAMTTLPRSTKSKRKSFLQRYEIPTPKGVDRSHPPINPGRHRLISLFNIGKPRASSSSKSSAGNEKSPLLTTRNTILHAPSRMMRGSDKGSDENDTVNYDNNDDENCDEEMNKCTKPHYSGHGSDDSPVLMRAIKDAVGGIVHPLHQDQYSNKTSEGHHRHLGKGWTAVKKHAHDGDFLVENILQTNEDSLRDGEGTTDETFFSCGHGHNNNKGHPQAQNAAAAIPSVSQMRQTAIEEFQNNMTFSPWACLFAIAIYLIISVLVFCFILEPEWTAIDSCYFAVTTFTTLGYGDLVPSSTISEVFTGIYALLGVAFLGLALGILGSKLLEIQGNYDWGTKVSREYDVLTLFDDPDVSVEKSQHNLEEKDAETSSDSRLSRHQEEDDTKDIQRSVESIESGFSMMRFLGLFGVALSMAFAIGIPSGWSTYQTLYYYVITGCTIGYGELTPETQMQRFLAIFFIPLAACVTGYLLAYFADWIIQVQSQKAWDSRVELHKELTVDDLRILDVNGDGTVTYDEFLGFMLLAMKKVDHGLLDALREYFDKLDVAKTGVLSKEDLIQTARRKLKSPRRKLELAEYKKRLLAVCSQHQQPERQQPMKGLGRWLQQSTRFIGSIREQQEQHHKKENSANNLISSSEMNDGP